MTPLIAAAVQVCMAVWAPEVISIGPAEAPATVRDRWAAGYDHCPEIMAEAERQKAAELAQRHDADDAERQAIYRRALRDSLEGEGKP